MNLRLTTRNWFFRWAYLFTTQQIRDQMKQTTLCDLFWRSVLLTPFQILVLAAFVTLIGFIVGVEGFLNVAFFVVCVAGGVSAIFGIVGALIFTEESIKGKRRNVITTVVEFTGEGVKGIKDRYCPIVRIESRES